MTADTVDAHLSLAIELAKVARGIVGPYYAEGLSFEDKDDLSPVTKADRETEAALRKVINAHFPHHGIYGEEYGVERADAEFVWVLDPIDGTKAFITGKPLFATLIGLFKEGAPYVGAMDYAALDEIWLGAPGTPSTCNGQPVKARTCADMSRAWLNTTSPQMHEGLNFDRFERVRHACQHTLYGADSYHYASVARGRSDIAMEHSLQPYDYAAVVPVIEGAGGRVTDWQGNRLGLVTKGDVLAAGDPALHEKVVTLLAS